uniref:Dymeclin n=2 Tax=Lygus hesperus TaxID=30085 RepID=A0A0A9Y9X8_LYGHE
MGAYQSNQAFSQDHVFKFVSVEHLPPDDGFWNSFLLVNFKPPSIDEVKNLFERLNKTCNTLYSNNPKSGNVSSLVQVFLSKSTELLVSPNKDSIDCCTVAHNSLFIIRCYIQYLLHKYPEKEIIKQIEAQGASQSKSPDEPLYDNFVKTLIELIVEVPINNFTYLLHCEIINVLLVLLSLQLFTTENCHELTTYKLIFGEKKAHQVCRILLTRFTEHSKFPASGGGSIILDFAVDLINYFLPHSDSPSPLARNSILLCVVLVNNVNQPNMYREYLSTVPDKFEELYQTICFELNKEETTLILYHLLHRNSLFRTYLLEREDIQLLVLPMLQTIYHASDSSCHHMYMSLIVLLILTEDAEFNKKVHKLLLKNVAWYSDRSLPEISLGGLIILVTTRTVQYNLLKMRDEYLHTNCLAALANMSSQFTNLHTYVCQRLVGLLEVLAKTYNRAKQELVAIERALRIILEVLNSCLSNQLVHNTNLIYTLLYKKSIFESLKNNPAFQDIINNLEEVLEYFTTRLEKAENPCDEVDAVLAVIVEASSKWPSHRLQKFPELKFKYVEEEKPEDFFIPYVWSLVTEHSNIYWNQQCFKNY